MSERDLKIFELYGKLAELLGDKEAIADLKKLYERHPEMFKNMQEVSSVIAEVVKEPEIIVDATHSNKDTGIYKAARRLGDKKMGDVGIRNDDGTNVIFHANKQDKRQFDRLLRKAEKNQLLVEASSANAAPTRSDHYASKSNNLPKCNKAPSITDKSIVSQTINKYQIVNKRENESVILKRLDDGDIEFVDKKGTTRKLTQDAQNLWKQTFELDSIEQIYIPKQSKEVLESLGYKELKLTKGSLLKLVEKDRVQYIPQIKETLENADFILRDIDNMVIFAKQIKDKEYFTSINLETQDYFISVSNAPKRQNILKNKVTNGSKIIYQSPNSESIFYTPELLQASQSSANKMGDSITSQEVFQEDYQKCTRQHNMKDNFTEDSILQRALELQTKQQRGELENFFTHQEGNQGHFIKRYRQSNNKEAQDEK